LAGFVDNLLAERAKSPQIGTIYSRGRHLLMAAANMHCLSATEIVLCGEVDTLFGGSAFAEEPGRAAQV